MSDVGVQKITSLQRCIARAREAYAAAGPGVRTNYNLQDAAILNVIRTNLDDSLAFAQAIRHEL